MSVRRHQRQQRISHAHTLVAETAKDMAHTLFEKTMQDNSFYSAFVANNPGRTLGELESLYITRMWPVLVEQARATLAGMLRSGIDEGVKERIMEALVLDNSLVRGRRAGGHIKL